MNYFIEGSSIKFSLNTIHDNFLLFEQNGLMDDLTLLNNEILEIISLDKVKMNLFSFYSFLFSFSH